MTKSKSRFVLAAMPLLITCCQQQSQELDARTGKPLIIQKPATSRAKAANSGSTSSCNLANPDTSLIGIKLRDAISAARVLGASVSPDSNGEYHYYCKLDTETLTLTQHPGDAHYQVSIINVKYSDKADHGYLQLAVDSFATEKGIRLGMSQAELIQRLGNCFKRFSNAHGYTKLEFSIEAPSDSKTKLLSRANLPVYYATYHLCNDKLTEMEFGFEYP